MPQIFISFIHEDELVATALRQFLEAKLPKGTEIFVASDESTLEMIGSRRFDPR